MGNNHLAVYLEGGDLDLEVIYVANLYPVPC